MQRKQFGMHEIEDMPAFLVARRAPDESNIVQLDPDSFPDAFAVGIFLVDIARHYARAMSSAGKISFDDCFSEILEGFAAEAQRPTNMGAGNIVRMQ